jgi:ribosomal protein S27AE
MGKKRAAAGVDTVMDPPLAPRRTTRAAPRPLRPSDRVRRKEAAEEHSDDGASRAEDDPEDDASEETPRKRRRDDNHRTCPHCRKVLSSALGYQYHVDHFVCRPTQRPGGPIVRRGRRKSTEATGTTYPRIRGKEVADRTCPQCQRVFTSVHGMRYHRGTCGFDFFI